MRRLIRNQEIRIDNHHRGDGTRKNWDDKSKVVHIDKFCLKDKEKYRFEVPINISYPITFKSTNVPSKIQTEIQNAFLNQKTRTQFIKELIDTLKNYDSILSDAERTIDAIRRISTFFNLKWNDKEICKHIDAARQKYNVTFSEKGEKFFVEFNPEEIIVGQKINSGK